MRAAELTELRKSNGNAKERVQTLRNSKEVDRTNYFFLSLFSTLPNKATLCQEAYGMVVEVDESGGVDGVAEVEWKRERARSDSSQLERSRPNKLFFSFVV